MRRLTAQSRAIIYLSMFVSGLVIATALLYLFTVRNDEGAGGPATWGVIGIAAIALLTVGFVFFVRARRTRYTKRLDQTYYAGYEHVSDLMSGSTLSTAERKEVLDDVLGLLLQAQQDRRPVSDVVGEDVAGFVARVQSSFGYRNRFLYHAMNGVQYSTLFLFLLQSVRLLEGGDETSFFQGRLAISMVTLLCVVSFLVMPLARYYVRRQNIPMVALATVGLGVAYIGILEFLRAFWYDVSWIRAFLDAQVALIPSWGALIFWVALAAAAQAAKWIQWRSGMGKLS